MRSCRAWPALAPLALLSALAAACGDATPRGTPSPGIDFSLNGVAYHLGTGAVVRPAGTSLLKLYFSDQPDTCFAITFQPQQTMTLLEVDVAPPDAGPTTSTVIAGGVLSTPGAGEAVATLSVSTHGTVSSSRDATAGTVAWGVNGDRSATLYTLDLGFAGTSDRLVAPVVTIPACPP